MIDPGCLYAHRNRATKDRFVGLCNLFTCSLYWKVFLDFKSKLFRFLQKGFLYFTSIVSFAKLLRKNKLGNLWFLTVLVFRRMQVLKVVDPWCYFDCLNTLIILLFYIWFIIFVISILCLVIICLFILLEDWHCKSNSHRYSFDFSQFFS